MLQTLPHPGHVIPERDPLPLRVHRFAAAWKLLLLPLAALFVVIPLYAHGSACGDDFPFHVTSWLDAARQLRSGVLYPRWAQLGAFTAGEPRFVFYPPLSWMLGSLLVLLAPGAPTSVIFIALALTSAGLAMYTLARAYTTTDTAIACAVLYVANPYMVCNAVERSAFAELLCATWVPLLLRSLLRRRPSVTALAWPLALLWLTNVPSAVTGVYLYWLLTTLRLVNLWWQLRTRPKEWQLQARTLLNGSACGFALGVALPAFYIVPAVVQKRLIHGASAFTGNLAISQNFLFSQDGYPIHDMLLRQVSWMAVGALAVGGICLLAVQRSGLLRPSGSGSPLVPERSRLTSEGAMLPRHKTAVLLAWVLALLGFALTPASTPFWHLPQLALVQFPWRLLTMIFPVVALSLALAMPKALSGTMQMLAASSLALLLALVSVHVCRRGSVVPHFDQYLTRLSQDHGFQPTPEYTGKGADDSPLGINDPAFWLADRGNAPSPGMVTNRAPDHMDPNFAPGWGPAMTVSKPAPRHLQLTLAQPQALVLHLRDYPGWQVRRNGVLQQQRLLRTDGLLALPLPAGTSTIDVQWHQQPDEFLGEGISLLAGFALCALGSRRRSQSQGHSSSLADLG